MTQPENKARENIDRLLSQAGWAVRDQSAANILASRGVAIRNFTLKQGHGFADYLLYVDGRAAGIVEAKKEGITLTGVETQSERYTKGLPDGLPAWSNPLPFSYESTGVETRFTNGLPYLPRFVSLVKKQITWSAQQILVVTYNPNIPVSGAAEQIVDMKFYAGQIRIGSMGALQNLEIRRAVCEVMEGGKEALDKRYFRISRALN
jgi:hypothetical protein